MGSYLREVRESRGVGLDEAARVTRIGRNYLAAIEGEMFDKLPSTAYVKGFLRVYADYLGLSGDEVVAMFDQSGKLRQEQQSVDSGGDRPQQRIKKRGTLPGRWLVPLLLLVVVVATAYLIGDRPATKLDESRTQPAASSADLQAVPPPAPVQPARSSAGQNQKVGAVVSGSSKSASVITADGTTRGGIILRLKVNQDSWLNITIDNSVSQQYDLKAGDLIEWKGEKVFALDIGNAGGIEGEFNGRPLKPFGEPGKSAHVVLPAQDK
ncbi:MAG TPA: helix-turn-helix domain-containing protein [Geobacteraceae bacterium]